MTEPATEISQTTVLETARAARRAARKLATLSAKSRNAALLAIANALESNREMILSANAQDCAKAEQLVAAGTMSSALFARLRMKETAIGEMAERVREVAALPDPIGKRLSATQLDDGLTLEKVSCPLGVVALVFEARPDVIPQVASLALKSGNAILLKGGSEAAQTNAALVSVWTRTLHAFPEIPEGSICLLHSRGDVAELLQLEGQIDLLIPRGSKEFVSYIERNSRVPVLGHGEGICHVYVDRAADKAKALAIVMDSKTQYPAACNSAETLLVHRDIAADFLPDAIARLRNAGVEVRGCDRTRNMLHNNTIVPATGEDWSAEYSDLVISVKIVDSLDEALDHIEQFGSRHTDCIVTEDLSAAELFLNEVDAAGVFHNASTRFADGYRYGLGAEVGISNSKLHARGPMGIDGLTTYKYKLRGSGQTVSEYSSGLRKFQHRPLS